MGRTLITLERIQQLVGEDRQIPSRIGLDPPAREPSSGLRSKCQRRTIANVLVCQIEQRLLDSLSTQTARTHFQALASNHPILNHFDSPADVIAQLHEHEEVGIVNRLSS
jgi:hypothetical protein